MTKKIAVSLHDVGVSYYQKSGLFKRPDRFWPLRHISFDVYQGETLGVIGRNGVGKSTLLRLMAGIVDPCEGIVNLHGNRAALLALQAGFIPHLTGRKNAMIGGMMLGMRKQEIESKINAIIAFSELGKFIDQPLQTYSSGMKMRLGFSVAVQANPNLLLIDEALGVGDEYFRKKSMNTMKTLIKSDKTVIFVSHAIPVMKELCNRIAWIEQGALRVIGNTNDVIFKYIKFINKELKEK